MVVEGLVSRQGCFLELGAGLFPDAFLLTSETASDLGKDVDANPFLFLSSPRGRRLGMINGTLLGPPHVHLNYVTLCLTFATSI